MKFKFETFNVRIHFFNDVLCLSYLIVHAERKINGWFFLTLVLFYVLVGVEQLFPVWFAGDLQVWRFKYFKVSLMFLKQKAGMA